MDDESILPIDQTIYFLLQNEALFNGGTVVLERVTEDFHRRVSCVVLHFKLLENY